MAHKVFDYKAFGRSNPVFVRVSTYRDGSLAIQLLSADEDEYGDPFGDVTKYIGVGLGEYQAVVKNYSENEAIPAFLEEFGLGMATGRLEPSGYVNMPVFQFDRAALSDVDPRGCAEYEKRKAGGRNG